MITLEKKALITTLLLASSSFLQAVKTKQDNIHMAAWRGDAAMVRQFIDRNPNLVNQTDNSGWTPLHCAAARGQEEVVRLLCSQPTVRVNKREIHHHTPLDYAFHSNNPVEIAYLLVINGAHGGKHGINPLNCRRGLEVWDKIRPLNIARSNVVVTLIMGFRPRTGANSPIKILPLFLVTRIIMKYLLLKQFEPVTNK